MATVGGVTQTQIDNRVRARLSNFTNGSTVTITSTSYYDYAGVAQPERITNDVAPLNVYNAATDCFEDSNGNNSYDADRGRGGLGSAEDIVRYQVSMSFPRIVPIDNFLGWSASETITGNTVLRNQPYAARAITTREICPP